VTIPGAMPSGRPAALMPMTPQNQSTMSTNTLAHGTLFQTPSPESGIRLPLDDFQARVLSELSHLNQSQARIERHLKVSSMGSPTRGDYGMLTRERLPGTPGHALNGYSATSESKDMGNRTLESPQRRARQMSRSGEASIAVDSYALPHGVPDQWPACVQLREALNSTAHHSAVVNFTAARSVKDSQYRVARAGEHLSTSTMRKRRYALDPHMDMRLCIDILCFLAVLHDMIMLPLTFAWDFGGGGPLPQLRVALDCFWLCEVGVNFVTGFHTSGGELEARIAHTARHYLTHWFLFDISLAGCGCLTWFVGPLLLRGAVPLSSSREVGRVCRFITMLRTVRAAYFYEVIYDRCMGETSRLWLTFSAMCFTIVWLTHVVSCIWFCIGLGSDTDTDGRWIADNTLHGIPLNEFSRSYQYWTSYHWTIAQLTLGGSDISPVSTIERIYNVGCLLAGFFISSTLVSHLSSVLIEYRVGRREQKQRLRVLRRFLKQRAVEATISMQVQRQVLVRFRDHGRLTLDEVPALQMLSTNMRSKLNYALFEPALCKHGLFRIWQSTAPDLLRKLVDKATTPRFLMIEDDLFVPGVMAENAYLILQGEVLYMQDGGPDATEQLGQTDLGEGQVGLECHKVINNQWLAEMALWMKWLHVGTAQAITQTDMISVSADGVLHLLTKETLATAVTREYGRLFHQRVSQAKPGDSSMPNDLVVPYCDMGDLFPLMHSPLQVALGKHFLELYQSKHRWNRGAKLDSLREEVDNGTSTIFMTIDGDLERVAQVTALRIESPKGDILTQVGKLKNGQAEVDCKLPGGKQQRAEDPDHAAKRVLATKLAPLAENVHWMRQVREVKWNQSASYDVRTKYLRTTCIARLVDTGTSTSVVSQAQPASVRHALALLPEDGQQMVEQLCEKPIFEHEQTLYVWLSLGMMETLLLPDNEWILQEWLLSRQIEVMPLGDAKMVLGNSGASSRCVSEREELPTAVYAESKDDLNRFSIRVDLPIEHRQSDEPEDAQASRKRASHYAVIDADLVSSSTSKSPIKSSGEVSSPQIQVLHYHEEFF